jgi:valyl-tRNA synthetase
LDKDFVPQAVKKTGKEALPERWILHKLNRASKDINQALEDREFSRSTQIAYTYIYDHLCDVFIENSKAIIQNGTADQKQSAAQTLYTAIEGGLLMIHPFMPFLSEELWQRLPRRPDDSTKSICVARVRCSNLRSLYFY